MDGIGPVHSAHRTSKAGILRSAAEGSPPPPSAGDSIDLGTAGEYLAGRKSMIQRRDLETSQPVVEKAWEVNLEPNTCSYDSDSYRRAPVVTKKGTVIVARGNELTGYDGRKGGISWRLNCEDTVCTRPVVAKDGTVYAASCDGKLYAVNGDTGEKKWSRKWNQVIKTAKDWVQDKFQYNGVGSLGAYRHKSTYPALSIGPDGAIYGSSSHRVFAFSEKGSRKFNEVIGDCILSSPAASSSGQVHVVISRPDRWGHAEDSLVGINGQTGEEAWSKSLYNAISNPVITVDKEGSVLIGQDHSLTCFRGDNGESSYAYGSDYTYRVPVPPRIGEDGTHYIVSGRGFDLIVHKEDKDTWTAFFKNGFNAAPVEGPYGTLIAIGKDGTGCIFRKEDGEKLAGFTCDRGAYGALELTEDGTLIVCDDRGISAYTVPFIKNSSLESIKAKHVDNAAQSQVTVEDSFIDIDGMRLPVRMRHISV